MYRVTAVNSNKLKAKIVENGLNISELAAKIGMDKSTLYRKIANNGETMTVKDANAIVRALNLTSADALAIFFSQIVA